MERKWVQVPGFTCERDALPTELRPHSFQFKRLPTIFMTCDSVSLRCKMNGTKSAHSRSSELRKVGENMYRDSSIRGLLCPLPNPWQVDSSQSRYDAGSTYRNCSA